MKARLEARVSRGKNAGARLTPHRYPGGVCVVSKTRFEEDYIRVAEQELRDWIAKGYSVRMSAPGIYPRLIHPASIHVCTEAPQ